jgi:tetraacyldisaccharide 4'-kinase
VVGFAELAGRAPMVGGTLSLQSRLDGPLGTALAPLGWLFAVIARARVVAFRRGLRASVRPPLPTLSIGNISAGGTGKTPLLLATLAWLEKHGASVGVLSRGYGGDEGRILEERFPHVRLVEGSDRVAGMRQLLGATRPELLLLDDGFQHLRLQRDLDIVVVDATRPFGRCFPAGLFREPLSALVRADLIVVSRAELVSEDRLVDIWQRIHRARPGKPSQARVEGGVQARDLRNLSTGEIVAVADFAGRSVVLAAGIGNPATFHQLCLDAGMQVESFLRFDDHHAWSAEDAKSFSREQCVVVTEKDGVKLRPFASEQMWELRIDWKFVRGAEVWERLLTDFHLPVRAAQIEPLWAAQDPDGRFVS